jgi:hypothetical protein
MDLDREETQFRHLAREKSQRRLLDNRAARVWKINIDEIHRQ